VQDGRDGFLVPIRDTDEIVDRLKQLADDPALWTALSGAARSHAELYTVNTYGQRLCAELAEI
jgi:glycosyltransferase involved in cell wall biosynthesis